MRGQVRRPNGTHRGGEDLPTRHLLLQHRTVHGRVHRVAVEAASDPRQVPARRYTVSRIRMGHGSDHRLVLHHRAQEARYRVEVCLRRRLRHRIQAPDPRDERVHVLVAQVLERVGPHQRIEQLAVAVDPIADGPRKLVIRPPADTSVRVRGDVGHADDRVARRVRLLEAVPAPTLRPRRWRREPAVVRLRVAPRALQHVLGQVSTSRDTLLRQLHLQVAERPRGDRIEEDQRRQRDAEHEQPDEGPSGPACGDGHGEDPGTRQS